jgi:hypothetical protein
LHLDQAIEAIGQKTVPVNSSPISPLKNAEATRLAWVEAELIGAYTRTGILEIQRSIPATRLVV